MHFPKHTNFEIEETNWGNASIEDIVAVLESAIGIFENYFESEKLPKKAVYIQHSSKLTPPQDHPKFFKNEVVNNIYISSQNMFWAQYACQFAHELCHHFMDCDYDQSQDKYGWLEESFAELASIFVLTKMSKQWESNPPYPNWMDFAQHLKSYADSKIEEFRNQINQSFYEWFELNLSELCSDRYKRAENGIIAIEILNIINKHPELWNIILFFKDIKDKHKLCMEQLLEAWRIELPEALKFNFRIFEELFSKKTAPPDSSPLGCSR
jgi:hypothetical protein